MEIPYTVSARPDTGLYNGKIGIWLFLASEVMLFGGLFSAYVFLRIGATAEVQWPHGLLNVPLGTFNTAVLIFSSVTMVLGWAALKMRNFKDYKKWMGITILCGFTFLGVKAFEYSEKFSHFGVILKDSNIQITGHLEKETEDAYVIAADPYESQGSRYRLPRHSAKAHGEGSGEHAEAEYFHKAGVEIESTGHGHPVVRIEKSQVRRSGYFFPKYSSYFAIYFTLTGLHALHVIGGMCVNSYFWGPGSKLYKKNPEHLANRVEIAGLFWHFVDLVWIFLFPVLYLL